MYMQMNIFFTSDTIYMEIYHTQNFFLNMRFLNNK